MRSTVSPDPGQSGDRETASPHYALQSGDEPEPIDLTFLNIEAAMMCLASKVRAVSGKADSPSLVGRTFRLKELDSSGQPSQPFSNCDSPLARPSLYPCRRWGGGRVRGRWRTGQRR